MRAVRPLVLLVAALLGLTAALPAGASPSATVEVIVVLEDGAPAPGWVAKRIADRYDASIGAVYEHALHGFSAKVPEAALRGLRNHPHVAWIEPDVEVSVAQTSEEVIPTGVDRIDADVNPMDPGLGLATNQTVEVAVLDTGIKADHPDLHVVAYTDCTDVIAFEFWGRTFLSGSCGADGNPYDEDGNGHGTHVAGTIGARAGNGVGVVGVAPDVRLWSIKVLEDNGTGGLGGILAGIDMVAANAGAIAVANMSFGFQGYSAALDTAVRNATDEGVVFVAAAGNDSIDVSNFAPASTPDAVAVSAVNDKDGRPGGLVPDDQGCYAPDPDDTLAPFSNYGAGIDIAAPGTCILSTYHTGGYATGSGTSMAAPHVTGAIARYIAEQEAINGPFANSRTGVEQILSGFMAQYTVPAGDPFSFVDDSGDGITEPMLYLGAGEEPPTPNEPPVANAGSDQTVPDSDGTNGETVTLDGSSSSDPDGTIASYEWSENGLIIATGSTASVTLSDGTHTITLTVTDDQGASDTDTVTITVQGPPAMNQPPDANAGPDQTVADTDSAPGETIGLDGTDSSDPDGTIASYEWSENGLIIATGSTASVTLSDGTHTVTLTVTDDDGATGTDTVTITVEPPPATDAALYVGDLVGASNSLRNQWQAAVTITVVDQDGEVSGATVSGTWSGGYSGTAACTTTTDGTCTVTTGRINARKPSVTFTVDSIGADGYLYDPKNAKT